MNWFRYDFARYLDDFLGCRNTRPRRLVYVVKCVGGVTKLGVTCDVLTRLTAMRDYPHRVLALAQMRLHASFADAEAIEALAGEFLAEWRHYNLSETLSDYYRVPPRAVVFAIEAAERKLGKEPLTVHADPLPVWNVSPHVVARRARGDVITRVRSA